MATPIKATPRLYGKDAKKFLQKLEQAEITDSVNPKVLRSYEAFKRIVEENKDVANIIQRLF